MIDDAAPEKTGGSGEEWTGRWVREYGKRGDAGRERVAETVL